MNSPVASRLQSICARNMGHSESAKRSSTAAAGEAYLELVAPLGVRQFVVEGDRSADGESCRVDAVEDADEALLAGRRVHSVRVADQRRHHHGQDLTQDIRLIFGHVRKSSSARQPVSRVLFPAGQRFTFVDTDFIPLLHSGDGHLSGRTVADALLRPTRG